MYVYYSCENSAKFININNTRSMWKSATIIMRSTLGQFIFFVFSLCVIVKLIPWRYIVVTVTFFATLSITAMRYCFSLTLTQMVKLPAADNAISLKDDVSCPAQRYDRSHLNNASMDFETAHEQYEWSQELQGLILSSFYMGYAIAHFPGGLIADWIGGKTVIVTALLTTVAITLSIPTVVSFGGAYGLIVLRIVMGFLQGGIFPAVNTILSAWVPQRERSRMASLIFCGYPLGSTIANFFSGIILHHHTDWHVVFYYFSVIGVISSTLFIFLCSSNPISHPFVTEAEKAFLRKEIGQLKKDKNLPPTPWKAILRSKPMIALIICSFLTDYCYYVLLIDLPKYMNDVLNVSVKENGIYSSIPWSVFVPVSLLSSHLCDWLISSERFSITYTRKLFVIISSVVDATFVISAAHGGCDPLIVGIFFAISVGATGLQTSGIFVNAIDLSPNYAGTICGLSSTFGALAGMLGPVVVGVLTPNSLQSEWRIVFWINFCMHIVKIALFTVWGSAAIQPWNNPERENKASHELGAVERNSELLDSR